MVIAKNEAAHIQRLLNSVRPFVDDMLVLDTGSTDATSVLAAQAGARVAHLPWPDDFSVARNAALDLAAADWHIVLDADEWLIDGDDPSGPGAEALQALRQTPPDFVGTIALEDQFDDGVAHARLSRILPGPVRYAGRIHEQAMHALPVKPLALRIGHDGYRSERLTDKQGRNQRLLQAALQDRPNDAYLWYQLGKDAFVYDDFAMAEEAFATCATHLTSLPAWWPDLVARRLFGLKRLGRHADGVVLADTQMAICEESPDVFFALGDLLLDWAAEEPTQADVLLPMIEQAWRRCLELGERPDQPGAVAGRGSHLAAFNLALVLDGTGRADEARALRQQFPQG
ncbi:Glycosyl transferase family 2 [Roseateles sp. YR242]|nr:Glycosyl transferase family 2 [Roseateles sp. YR242]